MMAVNFCDLPLELKLQIVLRTRTPRQALDLLTCNSELSSLKRDYIIARLKTKLNACQLAILLEDDNYNVWIKHISPRCHKPGVRTLEYAAWFAESLLTTQRAKLLVTTECECIPGTTQTLTIEGGRSLRSVITDHHASFMGNRGWPDVITRESMGVISVITRLYDASGAPPHLLINGRLNEVALDMFPILWGPSFPSWMCYLELKTLPGSPITMDIAYYRTKKFNLPLKTHQWWFSNHEEGRCYYMRPASGSSIALLAKYECVNVPLYDPKHHKQ
jgi:hypothetical protein